MTKKNIIIICLYFFLTNCGFEPIYLDKNKTAFSIEKIDYTGDRELNNFLKTNLNKYKNKKINNKIFIEANSSYQKIILSKNAKGEVTNYQLKAEVIFIIKPTNKKIKFNKKVIMDSMDDKFDEERYERSMKQNFAYSISNKLTSELIINQ